MSFLIIVLIDRIFLNVSIGVDPSLRTELYFPHALTSTSDTRGIAYWYLFGPLK